MAKEKKNWIKGAIKHPGSLRKALHVKEGETIPAKKLHAAEAKGGTIGKKAQLAENLKHMSHVGSHPEHAPHMGHGEHQGAHHHTDGSHKMGSGKKTVEMLNHEHSQHSDSMGKTVVAKPAAHPPMKSEGKVSVKTESKPLPPPSGKKGY